MEGSSYRESTVLANDKISVSSYTINMSPKHYIKRY